jgi:hypothetical protein
MQGPALLAELAKKYSSEYDGLPVDYIENDMFGPVDAELLYSMVRYVKPSKIVEIGSGWTTLIVAMATDASAMEKTKRPVFTTVDPGAPGFVRGIDGVSLIDKPLQEAGEDVLGALGRGDMLLVDSSHVVRPGNEVDVVLKALPDLKGVYVHFHDIFLPDPYPSRWSGRGYDEQEHLGRFLEAHPTWEVLISAHQLHTAEPQLLAKSFKSYDQTSDIGPGSLWILQDGEAEDPKKPHAHRPGRGPCDLCGRGPRAEVHLS